MTNSRNVETWSLPVAGIRPAALLFESDPSLREALARALSNSGYDVTVAASVGEAQHLMRERSFERIYSDMTIPMNGGVSEEASSGSRIEDLQDGSVRIQIDQVMPWSAAVHLLDVLADNSPGQPQLLS